MRRAAGTSPSRARREQSQSRCCMAGSGSRSSAASRRASRACSSAVRTSKSWSRSRQASWWPASSTLGRPSCARSPLAGRRPRRVRARVRGRRWRPRGRSRRTRVFSGRRRSSARRRASAVSSSQRGLLSRRVESRSRGWPAACSARPGVARRGERALEVLHHLVVDLAHRPRQPDQRAVQRRQRLARSGPGRRPRRRPAPRRCGSRSLRPRRPRRAAPARVRAAP